jgi:S-formylglutathione hydrolase FrmB
LGTVFGNPIDVQHWNANSPFELARKNRIAIAKQAIYFNCGEQDEFGFAEGATKLHTQLQREGIRHEFHLYPGGHDAEYFLSHLHETVEFHWKVFSGLPAK